MIARTWHGYTSPGGADAYVSHLLTSVLPKLRGLDGFAGLEVLRATREGEIEFRVVTYWESMDAIRAFAGSDPERAVVADEARAVLTRFDAHVSHHEVVAKAGRRG